MREKINTFFVLAGVVVLILLVPGLWVFKSHMEARAYNRATGSHVSTWDAMWVDLRVQDGAKK